MTEELFAEPDNSNVNDCLNVTSTNEVETAERILQKRQISKWFLTDQIDFEDNTHQVRLKEDEDTVERYANTWQNEIGGREIVKGTKSPFPEILVEEREDGKYRIVSGWHRALGAKKAGLSKIYGKIVSGTPDELLKLAMNENDKNALAINDGDLRYCIEKVQKLHPEWLPATVVVFLGKGSPSYAAKIEKEHREQQAGEGKPLKRLGKDGKWYSVSKNPKDDEKSQKKPDKTSKAANKTGPKKSRSPKKASSKKASSKKASSKKASILKITPDFFRTEKAEGMSLVLDSCEECLALNPDEKKNMYEKVIQWVEQRINLSDYINNKT